MVWQSFIRSKNTNSDNNLASSSLSSLPPISPFSSSVSTPTMPSNVSPTVNRTQHASNSKSSSNHRTPQPPPRSHRPTTARPSAASYPRNTDNDTTANGTSHNDLPFSMTPAGRFFTQFFDDAMQHFNYPMHDIVWSEEPPIVHACDGNSASEKIIDNDEKFSIEIDLSDFLAGELVVSYNEEERELLVEGHHTGRNDRHGSVERNFKRKFDIPSDTHDGSLAAYLTSSGLLTIQAFKKGNKQPIRRIPIQKGVDVPDSHSANQNVAKTPKFEAVKNAVTEIRISPPIPPKAKNASELKNAPEVEKMSVVIEGNPATLKVKEHDEKQLNFDEMRKGTGKPTAKQEYLNIFC